MRRKTRKAVKRDKRAAAEAAKIVRKGKRRSFIAGAVLGGLIF